MSDRLFVQQVAVIPNVQSPTSTPQRVSSAASPARRRFALGVGAAAVVPSVWSETDFPNRPLRFVVPVAAGGLTDILTRMLAQKLQQRLGQPVVVDNKPGAGGIIGMENAARSAPDGYSMVMSYIGVAAVNPWIYPSLSYNPLKDFEPVSFVANFPMVLAVHPSVPARTVSEFVDLLRQRPSVLNYGSAGNATTAHLAMTLFLKDTGTRATHVPYKGAAPAMNDLLAGQISAVFDSLTLVLPQIRAGRLRALGIASPQRSALAPDLPTIAESGVPGFVVTGWYGVLMPAGTPKPIVDRLSQEFREIVSDPEMRKEMASRGIEATGSDPATMGKLLRDENDKWRQVVAAAGIRAD